MPRRIFLANSLDDLSPPSIEFQEVGLAKDTVALLGRDKFPFACILQIFEFMEDVGLADAFRLFHGVIKAFTIFLSRWKQAHQVKAEELDFGEITHLDLESRSFESS